MASSGTLTFVYIIVPISRVVLNNKIICKFNQKSTDNLNLLTFHRLPAYLADSVCWFDGAPHTLSDVEDEQTPVCCLLEDIQQLLVGIGSIACTVRLQYHSLHGRLDKLSYLKYINKSKSGTVLINRLDI